MKADIKEKFTARDLKEVSEESKGESKSFSSKVKLTVFQNKLL